MRGLLPLALAAGLGLLGPGGRGLLLGRALPAPALGLGPGRGAPGGQQPGGGVHNHIGVQGLGL